MNEITTIDNYEYNGERTDTAEFYEKHGFAVIPNAVSDEALDMYEERWNAEFGTPENKDFTAWEDDKAYMHVPELKEVLCHKGVNDFFKEIDIAVALHVTKTRMNVHHTGWHLDAVHPHEVGPKNYVGGMVSLGDCDETNGAIEIIPGSHKWDINYRERFSQPDQAFWPKGPEFEEHRQTIDAPIVQLNARRGDLHVWHGRSVHRAAEPKTPGKKRPAVVGHWCNRLVAETEAEKAGGHVPYEIMADDLLTNKSTDNDHFFQRWGDDGGFYYPNCTITREWLRRYHPEVPNETVQWEELPSYGISHDDGDPLLLLPDGGGKY